MIRPFTLIAMLLAAFSGAYLFAVKHRAQVLDDQLAAVTQQSRLDSQRIRVLQAQWALETDPTRLAQLAGQFTTLQPMQPAQLVTLAALPEILPPAGGVAPSLNPAGAAPAMLVTAGAAAVSTSGSLPLPPELPPALAQQQARPVSVASVAVAHVPHPASHSALHIAATHYVESLAAPRPYSAPYSPPYSVSRPLAAAPQAVPEGAQMVPVAATPGSALGMAATALAAPQPLPQNGTDN